MVDYVKLAATAKRLIEANGRSITFVRDSETPVDVNKPWLGPTGADTTLILFGVFVPPDTVRQFGLSALGQGTEFKDLISFSEEMAIVFPDVNELRQFTHVEDETIRWGITGIQILKPSTVQLLAFIGLRR